MLFAYRAYFLAAGLALALGVSGFAGYKIGKASGNEMIAKIYKAGQDARVKADAKTKKDLEKYREDLANVSARKLKRVYCRSTSELHPTPARRTSGASAIVPDNHDYGPDLRAARDALIRCQALIEYLN